MTKALEQFIDEIMNQTSVVLNLSALQQTNPGLIEHALNVAISSLCIGKTFKFSYEEMKQLGSGHSTTIWGWWRFHLNWSIKRLAR